MNLSAWSDDIHKEALQKKLQSLTPGIPLDKWGFSLATVKIAPRPRVAVQ
jgi:hypothetical protein